MEFHQQLIHQHHLQPYLQCGNDPTVANHNGILSTTHARKTVETPFTMRNRSDHDPRISENDPTTHETVSHPSHSRGRSSTFGDGLCMEKHRVSCICYLSKTHFVRDFLQNSIGNSSTSTTCNPIYSEGTILELQITMEFHLQLIHQHHLQSHLHCGNDPTVANHNGILSTTHARKTVETPFTMRNRSEHDPPMIRPWSDHDPTTHETVSHPSHRRGRSSRFVDTLCMEKHRVSCICYLSKTHFVRDFLQNSIRQLIHQHHLQSHLQWGNDPRVANHNGIPSATHPPAPLAIPFTLRERSYSCKSQWNSVGPHMHEKQLKPHLQCGTDPSMIRPWSAHDPTMIRPHTRPSRTRRTAEVDHRGSGTHFVWKNIGFRASAISQKRISCETSFNNSIGNSSTSTTCNPICIAGTINALTNSFCD